MRRFLGEALIRVLFGVGRVLALALGVYAFGFLIVGRQPTAGYADDEVRLNGNHPAAAEAFTPLGNAAPDAPLAMQVRFAVQHQGELAQLLADQQNPASPQYHKWLKTGEFAHRFGPSEEEVEALEAWLKSGGFTITRRAPDHLEFAGNVAQAQQAFEVTIARFGDGSLYANTSDPIVPQRLAGVIGAISGIDNMVRAMPVSRPPKPAIQLAQAESDAAQSTAGGPIGGVIINNEEAFGPGDVRAFYDETVGKGADGTGDCIAIVGISDFVDSAMTAFTNQFNLPAVNYTRQVYGTNPGLVSAGESEAELDLQWAHTAAPGAAIVYHLGSDLVTDIGGAVTANQCGAISISYAFCSPTQSLIEGTLDPLFEQAATQGQSVFVSSGDNGAAGLVLSGDSCVPGSARSVNEMSADPNVTSVGGTQFTPTYAGGNDVGYATEKAWNDGIGASGGGASQFFSKPSYQTGSGVPNDGARDVPDVALIASPEFPGVFWGHDVEGTGQITCCIGGTSLAAPLWAGFSRVIAELTGSTRLGRLNSTIYGLADTQYATAGFHDITSGNNNFNGVTGFSAGPGYDQVTGWGTVDFNVFADAAKNWIAGSVTPTPTATATPTSTATIAGSATATPTPTVQATPTAAITITTTPTPAPTSSAIATPTAIGTITTTATPAPTSTVIATPTAIGSITSTATPAPTPVQTAKPTATAIATLTATANPTPTLNATATAVPTPTPNMTATGTAAATPTPTPVAEPLGGTLSVPTTVSFPATGIGMPAKIRTVLISNRNVGSNLTINVGTLPPPFTVFGAGQYTLEPFTSVRVTIVFTPASVGLAEQKLPISSGDPRRPYVNVVVTGMVQAGKLTATPSKVALVAKSGSPVSKTVTLRNSGKGMLSGTVQPFAPASPLKLMGGPVSFTLPPGQSQPITIQFTPANNATVSANLTIETTPPPATTTIAVTGSVR